MTTDLTACAQDSAARAMYLPEHALDLDDPSRYLNREIELLKFQERVLEEASDQDNPLLERVRFLSIAGSNIAEFYMVRIAGLRQMVATRLLRRGRRGGRRGPAPSRGRSRARTCMGRGAGGRTQGRLMSS